MSKKITANYYHRPYIKEHVDKDALLIIKRLHRHHFQAYLVGGCVRDLLLGLLPKDFDIVTDARPEQIKKIFSHVRLIGRRFRLAHIVCQGRKYIEVSTFRGESATLSSAGQIIRDNLYGDISQDVKRRDLTINALYYDIKKSEVIDYVGGINDLENKCLKIIGDDEKRYREDPVRMIRMVRFQAKLSFQLLAKQCDKINKMANLLQNVSVSRLFDESLKLLHNENACLIMETLQTCGLWQFLFAQTPYDSFVIAALKNTQTRVKKNQSLTASFVYSVLLWQAFLTSRKARIEQDKDDIFLAGQHASDIVIGRQREQTMLTNWVVAQIKDIWLMQGQLEKRHPKKITKLLAHKRFRAAYDFLWLRSISINPELVDIVEFWHKKQQTKLVNAV